MLQRLPLSWNEYKPFAVLDARAWFGYNAYLRPSGGMADAVVSKTSVQTTCEFDSRHGHHAVRKTSPLGGLAECMVPEARVELARLLDRGF